MVPQDLLASVTPDMAHRVLFAGKIAGAIGAIGAVGYAVFGFLFKVIRNISEIQNGVKTMLTNHLPHMQSSLDDHGLALDGIKSDVRDLDTRITGTNQRLDDTRASVHTLGTVFTDHIEASARDLAEAKAEAVKNELDIAAIKAAQKILDDAAHVAAHLVETTKRHKRG